MQALPGSLPEAPEDAPQPQEEPSQDQPLQDDPPQAAQPLQEPSQAAQPQQQVPRITRRYYKSETEQPPAGFLADWNMREAAALIFHEQPQRSGMMLDEMGGVVGECWEWEAKIVEANLLEAMNVSDEDKAEWRVMLDGARNGRRGALWQWMNALFPEPEY